MIKQFFLVFTIFLTLFSCKQPANISGSGEPSSSDEPSLSEYLFYDDFTGGNYDNWTVKSGNVSIVTENNKKVLKYSAGSEGIALVLKDSVWSALQEQLDSGGYFIEMLVRPDDYKNGSSNKNFGIASHINEAATKYYYAGVNTNGRLQMGVYGSGSSNDVKGLQGNNTTPVSLNTTGNGFYKLRYEYRKTATEETIMLFFNDIQVNKSGKDTFSVPSAGTSSGPFGIHSLPCDFTLAYVKADVLTKAKTSLKIETEETAFTKLSENTVPFIAFCENEITLREGDSPLSFTVTATKEDGMPGSFTVSTSTSHVNADKTTGSSGDKILVTPVSEGTSTLIISNGAEKRSFIFTVLPALPLVFTDYGDLSGKINPIGSDVFEDEALSITFDNEPVLTESASVLIYKKDGTLADEVKPINEINAYGSKHGASNVGGQLLYKDGNSVKIIPHSNKLLPATEYYVVIPNGTITATLNGKTFTGFGHDEQQTAQWSFTTRAAYTPSNASQLSVAKTGTADFRTIQAAINYAASNLPDSGVVITLAAGVYHEKPTWNSAKPFTLKGGSQTAQDTRIAFENCDALNTGTDNRPLFWIGSSSKVIFENLTLENTRIKTGSGDQAETVYFNSTGIFLAKNVRFISRQDTVLMKGNSYFKDCYISGDVDYIWGYVDLALFDSCEINSRSDNRNANQPAYVVQARANAGKPGFVFKNCTFTYERERTGNIFFARTGGVGSVSSNQDSVAVIDCSLKTDGLLVDGWSDDGGKTVFPHPATAVTGWREYANKQNSSPFETTSAYVKKLTTTEYEANYATRDTILSIDSCSSDLKAEIANLNW